MLTSDRRFEAFAVVFALGTIHHELQFFLEQQLTGPLDQYMERIALLKPTVEWPSAVGIALHAACVLLGALVLVLPWRRALLALMAGPGLLSQLFSPERIPSHNSLMVAAWVLVLLFAIAELVERRLRRRSGGVSPWLSWTSTGLIAVVSLTYVFASFYKWNPVFFWPASSPAADFVTPYASVVGLSRQVTRLLVWPAIVGTVLIELTLPVLLLWRRTRLAAAITGLVFHLMMMGQGVMDFPVLIVAFYPLFFRPAEFEALLQRCRARPSVVRSGLFLAGSGLGFLALTNSRYVAQFWSGAAPSPWLLAVYAVALHLTLYLAIFLAVTLAAALLRPGRLHAIASPEPAPAT